MTKHENELNADISKLIESGLDFKVRVSFSRANYRYLTILDYIAKDDNPFNLTDDINILYVKQFVDGEWFWKRDSMTTSWGAGVGILATKEFMQKLFLKQ